MRARKNWRLYFLYFRKLFLLLPAFPRSIISLLQNINSLVGCCPDSKINIENLNNQSFYHPNPDLKANFNLCQRKQTCHPTFPSSVFTFLPVRITRKLRMKYYPLPIFLTMPLYEFCSIAVNLLCSIVGHTTFIAENFVLYGFLSQFYVERVLC